MDYQKWILFSHRFKENKILQKKMKDLEGEKMIKQKNCIVMELKGEKDSHNKQLNLLDWIELTDEEKLLLNKIRAEAEYEGYKFSQKTSLLNNDELVFKKIYFGGEKMKRPKIEIDGKLEGKINAETQWEIYRETFERDKIDRLSQARHNALQQRPDWEEEIIEEVIQQLKEEQKKLDEEEK